MRKVLFITLGIIVLLGGLAGYQYVRFNDGQLHVIFCDVGQGDAIIIKTPDRKVILVDGGPDNAVAGCLSRYLPFWEREVDLVLLTHPHSDHFFGMFSVLERYEVKSYASIELINTDTSHQELHKLLNEEQIPQRFVLAGDAWMLGNVGEVGEVGLKVVGPSESDLKQMNPGGTINECDACASLALNLTYGTFSMLLTGDSEDTSFTDMLHHIDNQVSVLQIPHHGSRTGIDQDIIQQIAPRLAIISVGAENRYNHPHPTILELLSAEQIPVRRTDLEGDVEIVSDGKEWGVR